MKLQTWYNTIVVHVPSRTLSCHHPDQVSPMNLNFVPKITSIPMRKPPPPPAVQFDPKPRSQIEGDAHPSYQKRPFVLPIP
ncbi:hypothetical protein BDZ45DRAFT_337205 [Acephala macrosclerotiorum]|nr:hypothetical protein BDZ45DRAFT_337205 [Acephala macrosclerotiorum]